MSIRGTVTFECDQKRCHAEHVIEVETADANLLKNGGAFELVLSEQGWRIDDDNQVWCPQPATRRELTDYALNVTARISDIRRAGYLVICDEHPNGLSIYRLGETQA